MLTKEELAGKSATELAVLCQRIADNPSDYYTSIANDAKALKLEWVRLQTSPNPDYEKQKTIEAEKLALKTRMVEFLASTL